MTLIFSASGCWYKTTTTYRYDLETGERVYLQVETGTEKSDKRYELEVGPPIVVLCNGETVSEGVFLSKIGYDEYINAVEYDQRVSNAEFGRKDGNDYLYWEYDANNGTKYNYVIWVEDAEVGVLLHNTISEESAKECFSRLHFSGSID